VVLGLMLIGGLYYLRRKDKEEDRRYDQEIREPSEPSHPTP
jgi:hypothetical protein